MACWPKNRTMTSHQLTELIDTAKAVFEHSTREDKGFLVDTEDMRRLYSILAELHVIPHGFRKKKSA
jgi:hypothetical protein